MSGWLPSLRTMCTCPAIAPDGRRIAFTVKDGGRTLLHLMDDDGSHVRVLADSLALRGNPGWTPDGQAVVSAVLRDGEPRLTRIFLNGDPPLPLVSEYSIDRVWSPDGRFFVYSGADVGTTFPLRVAAADGRPHPLPSVMLTRGVWPFFAIRRRWLFSVVKSATKLFGSWIFEPEHSIFSHIFLRISRFATSTSRQTARPSCSSGCRSLPNSQ